MSTCFIARLQSKTHNRETIKVPFLLTRLESFVHSFRGLLGTGNQALSEIAQRWEPGSLRDCLVLGARLSQRLLSVGSQALSEIA